jgi:tetratricopeptide (TPR) repeat protein
MTCDEVQRDEIAEKYLHDQLNDESREAFEQHYFECGRCFTLLQRYRDLQAELASTRDDVLPAVSARRWVWQWAWVPAMAAIVLAVGLTLWQRPIDDRRDATQVTASPEPSGAERPPAPPPAVSLADLARIEPPRYTPGRLRGAGDEATARYQEAMKNYARGDYVAASAGLKAAAALDPEAPHIVFFLGISQLMSGQFDGGISALRQTLALGDSPFTEEAHFFLAKAYLRKENLDAARAELERTAQMRGTREAEAGQLLLQLERFARQPR